MKIIIIPVSPLAQNCRILVCEETLAAAIVDAGYDAGDILARVAEAKVKPQYLLATHGHFDHVGAAVTLQEKFGIPFYMHQADAAMAGQASFIAARYGMAGCRAPRIDGYLTDGQVLTIGNCQGKVLHTPGHSPGSVCFLFGSDLVCGDLLFAGAVGRTDLPGGSVQELKRSLREKILPLPADTRVHSGHGPNTTLGEEEHWLRDFVNGEEDEL
jgi:glyoxylase-like metal-dependent hydrolase (beta-lactamase superfamily II)